MGAAMLAATLSADQAPQTPPTVPLTLQSAFSIAEEHNRTLVAARLGRAVDVAGIAVAGQRPNPEASFEAARDTPHEIASVAFPLEFGGKRARRVDLANATLARTVADLTVQSLDIRRTVRLAYYELVAAASRVQVTTELRGFAERTRNAARDRFESGRRRGSRRSRPIWHSHRRTTNRKPRAGGSRRRAHRSIPHSGAAPMPLQTRRTLLTWAPFPPIPRH